MYWNITTLTKMGSILHQSCKGPRQEVLGQLQMQGLDLISIQPDYKKYVEQYFHQGKLSGTVVSSFFKDFSRSLKSGLSAHEAILSLQGQATDPLLKAVLEKLNVSIIDGHSFKDAFEGAKVFPRVVLSSLDAAEKSGNLIEVSLILSEYFKFMNENKLRLVKSLIYPACVFIALTAASVVISIKLVPQLGSILPASQQKNLSTQLIMGYAGLMQSYWWGIFGGMALFSLGLFKLWEQKKSQLLPYVFKIPVLGDLIKELELTFVFLNLYVYQKSGINIITAMTNIYANHPNFVTQRLVHIRNLVNQGHSFGDALKTDDFFPSFVQMNVRKGELTGNLGQYLYEIYQYYDQRSKDSIELLITYINPLLLTIAVAYLGLIINCFILPLYSSLNGRGM